MKEQIEVMLKPFVTAVYNQLGNLRPKFNNERYHYGYGFSLSGYNNWYNDYDLKHLDDLMVTKEPTERTNIDILLENFRDEPEAEDIRFDHTLFIEEGRFMLVATASHIEQRFEVTMMDIENRGFEAPAKEFVELEINAHPNIQL